MKLSNQKIIFAIVAFFLMLLAQGMYSSYTANKCEEGQKYSDGYRCYAEDKKTFDSDIRKCEYCTKGPWAKD